MGQGNAMGQGEVMERYVERNYFEKQYPEWAHAIHHDKHKQKNDSQIGVS